ncbi:hypothetical protein UCRPC4_g05034 [Phaeomoniella chlamydospora]|uniref:Uncharacterized protein n=1 Tax=Phaeomoniella chlamydospora TaxID=158046 RepID=A0A0G2G386_PHACM|nr:hypothetical protein UCRPC4_g05034 [Phaeomoniella chlamydospora]
MCHTSCIEEDAGSLKSFLTTIKDWLDASNNTCEVLTLLLVNSDDLDVSEFGSVFEAVGLDSYAYAPSKTLSSLSSWPTLSSLISSSTRLIVFMDYEADTSSVPYILDEFTYFFETPYDTTDPDFPQCSIDRPSDLSTAEAADSRMYLVNHFLDDEVLGILIPDEDDAATTNSVQSIAGQVEICLGLYENRAPKGVLVDYLEKGSVFEAERLMNNLVS